MRAVRLRRPHISTHTTQQKQDSLQTLCNWAVHTYSSSTNMTQFSKKGLKTVDLGCCVGNWVARKQGGSLPRPCQWVHTQTMTLWRAAGLELWLCRSRYNNSHPTFALRASGSCSSSARLFRLFPLTDTHTFIFPALRVRGKLLGGVRIILSMNVRRRDALLHFIEEWVLYFAVRFRKQIF